MTESARPSEGTASQVSAAVPPAGLPLDGEVLSGRLMIYADTLALGLIEMADKFDALSPEVLLYAGQTPGRVLRDIGAQLAQAVIQYQESEHGE